MIFFSNFRTTRIVKKMLKYTFSVMRSQHLLNRTLHTSPARKQQGYIILVPEIGEDTPEKNPVYRNEGLPEFNNITIENCRAAIAKQTLDFEARVQEIEKKITTDAENVDVFKDVFVPLEEVGIPMNNTWGLSKTLYLGNSTLMPTSSYLAIHDRARKASSARFNSKTIFEAVKKEISSNKSRTTEEQRLLRKFWLEGKLNGLDLNQKGKDVVNYNLMKVHQEKQGFKMKNDMAIQNFSHICNNREVVKDFPEPLLKAISLNSQYPQNGPWKFTLHHHVYPLLMEHCPDREIRWNLWQAQVGRGSTYRDRDLATGLHVEEIRFSKRKIANQLGYSSYAEMSMETKMADSVEDVQKVFAALLEKGKPAQDAELEGLTKFAQEQGFQSDRLELWDVPFWRRQQRNSLFSNYNESEIRNYFPVQKVVNGLFSMCEKLFNISIAQRKGVTTWHKDVRFYHIFQSGSTSPIAGFYLDLFARPDGKFRSETTGWTVGIQSKSDVTHTQPLAALIFNFEKLGDREHSLLTFKEVTSLFSKVGQAMRHLLTTARYSEVAGHSNVEWDAVEVCENVFSHLLLNKQVIDSISEHCDTGDSLPQKTFDDICQVQKHLAGFDLCQELYLSSLDLEIFSSKDYWLDILKRLWPQYQSLTLHKIYSIPCSFSEIISEEYSAAYYSHIWSRMLAADIYGAFQEASADEQQIKTVGKRFRDTFVGLGGSQHSSLTFREFRGRDPSPKALLSSLGLEK